MTRQMELSRKDRLKRLETEIAEDVQAFVRVGRNLLEIKRDELWKEAKCNSFKEYIDKKWTPRIDGGHAQRLIKAAVVSDSLHDMPSGISNQTSEGLIRPLEAFVSIKDNGQTIEIQKDKIDAAVERAEELAKLDERPISDKYIERAVNEIIKGEKSAGLPKAEKWTGDWKIDAVYVADVTSREWLDSMPEGKVDFIITDPPWRPDAEGGFYSLYEAVGKVGLKVLRPGGFCAVYMGKLDLPILLQTMMAYLDYEWTFAVYQPDNSHNFRKTQYKEAWRPIGIFRKPGQRTETIYAPDAMICTKDKSFHEWQQGIEPVKALIEKYTAKGHLVLDPFVGGGTGPMAAKELGRHYLAFDRDERAVAVAKERLNGR